VDIDPAALEVAQGLVSRMVREKEADIAVAGSADRRDLLPAADVVVTTIGVGGREAWEADVVIPRRYGIYQPVGDTAMAGGVSRAMRMIPANVDIAADVLRLCPDCLYINYSNPMTANCRAIGKATGADVVGLCHGTDNVFRELIGLLGLDYEECSYLAAGINHFTWIYDLRHRGRDLWPDIIKRLDAECRERNPFCWGLFDAYSAYPAVNDRHVVEFFPERFADGGYYGRGLLGVDVFSVEDVIASGARRYESMRAQAEGSADLDEAVFARSAGEHEQLLEIIGALRADDRRMFPANLPNRGTIADLPDDAVVETSAVATGRGLAPVRVRDFPQGLAVPLGRRLASVELTVEAALTGSRAMFVEALLADGSVRERAKAEALAEDFLAAHRAYLPQFA
jgi:alpha-galactosidase